MAYYERTYRLGFGGGITPAIKYLLIINTAIFILQQKQLLPIITDVFSLSQFDVFGKLYLWQIFSYMFLHGGVLHLVFNMFVLWLFGCEVERTLGTREFVKYYLICGMGAGVCHMLINPAPVVGASGAIFGVMAAFAVLFPERVITLLLFLVLPVQIKAKYFVMIFAIITLMMGVFGSGDGVAHFAHLGGLAVGFIYLKLDWRLQYLGNWFRQRRESQKAVHDLKKYQAMQRIRERVDEILDKINEVGYDGLSPEEKRILQEASERFGQEKEQEK